MVSIVIMIGGALISATAFAGGNYLVRVLSADNKAKAEEDRRERALDAYNRERDKLADARRQVEMFMERQSEVEEHSLANIEDTNAALKLYNRTHPEQLHGVDEPHFSNFYTPSREQEQGEIVYTAGGMAILGFLAYRFTNVVAFKLYYQRYILRETYRKNVKCKGAETLAKVYYSTGGYWRGEAAIEKLIATRLIVA